MQSFIAFTLNPVFSPPTLIKEPLRLSEVTKPQVSEDSRINSTRELPQLMRLHDQAFCSCPELFHWDINDSTGLSGIGQNLMKKVVLEEVKVKVQGRSVGF